MIDVHYASLTSQGVQHRVFYLDGHPSRYQPRPTGLNFGERTGTAVFPLVIAVPKDEIKLLLTSAESSGQSFIMSYTNHAVSFASFSHKEQVCSIWGNNNQTEIGCMKLAKTR